MYIDKPMKGHNLMQAIARVNRVFGQKPGGLVVDYLGIAQDLKAALMEYTEGDRGETGISDRQKPLLGCKRGTKSSRPSFTARLLPILHGTPPERLTVLHEAPTGFCAPTSRR
jgi:type I restriction enzyme R subunit